jgi:hypothetical protein
MHRAIFFSTEATQHSITASVTGSYMLVPADGNVCTSPVIKKSFPIGRQLLFLKLIHLAKEYECI